MKANVRDLGRQVSGTKAALLLAGINTGRDVIFAPNELGTGHRPIYSTIVVPSDVDTYYYARPLTHQPIFQVTTCRICDSRIKVYKANWTYAESGESTPVCSDCLSKGYY